MLQPFEAGVVDVVYNRLRLKVIELDYSQQRSVESLWTRGHVPAVVDVCDVTTC